MTYDEWLARIMDATVTDACYCGHYVGAHDATGCHLCECMAYMRKEEA